MAGCNSVPGHTRYGAAEYLSYPFSPLFSIHADSYWLFMDASGWLNMSATLELCIHSGEFASWPYLIGLLLLCVVG